ncbi:hypothetical protein F511_06025 [Dorcoceras hygrometricum]|uniref:Uncharacterized protein n=1 Tax=Dorcoceras hygrometricum TaxID=472368 RepID=A0A2Z7B367_9LAMI|nr:hypothetical protein F511_06025 [Dorcoceras hygrometricum]
MRIRPPELETSICDAKYHCFIGREHCDVLSMQMDSDLVIYRTTLVRTFQVGFDYNCITQNNLASTTTLGRPLHKPHGHAPPLAPPRAAASCRTCSGHRDEEFPSVLNPSSLLVQIDGGRLNPVVDLIGGSTAAYSLKCRFSRETGRSQAPRRQQAQQYRSAQRRSDNAAQIRSRSSEHIVVEQLRS